MRRSLEQPIHEIVPNIKVEIKQIFQDELSVFQNVVARSQYFTFEKRLNDNSNLCFAAFSENILVGYCWMRMSNFHSYMGQSIYDNKISKAAYFYDIFILPEFRNHGLMKAFSAFRFKYCINEGCTNILNAISTWNTPSLRAAEYSGFTPIKSITIIVLFGKQFLRLKACDKHLS